MGLKPQNFKVTLLRIAKPCGDLNQHVLNLVEDTEHVLMELQ